MKPLTVADLFSGAGGFSEGFRQAGLAVIKAVDLWGPVEGLDLMRRVKAQFDPEGRLSPGRFVGGI